MVELAFSTRQFSLPSKEIEYTEGIPFAILDEEVRTYIASDEVIGLVDT